jgi:VanZ family protein
VHNTTKESFLKHNWPGISWALLILALCTFTTPSLDVPDLFDLIKPDKVAHFFFYAVYVILFQRSFSTMPSGSVYSRNQYSLPLLSGILYGGLIEIYQGLLLPNRTADYVDVIANAIGAIIGWMITRMMGRYRM